MKTKQLSRYLGGSWQTPVDIGADAQNVDYSKVVDGSTVNTNVKAELDAIHNEIDGIDSAKVDVEGGSTGDLIAGKVTADNSATIAAIADIIDSDTVDEIWGRFNRLKTLVSAHELTQLSTVNGVHGFRYYNNELSYYNGTDWVAIAAGHDIKDESGTTMTKRDNLQFVNLIVSDDSTNNKTVVKNPIYEFNTIDEMNDAIEDGDIEDGAVIYVKQGSGGGGVSFVFGPLPASGTEGTFYFVSNGSFTGTNLYDEYVWDINASRFELISSNIEIDAIPTQGSPNPVSSNGVYDALQAIIIQLGSNYSIQNIYNKDDIVVYNGDLYKANQDISVAEVWTPVHWNKKTVAELIKEATIEVDSSPTQSSANAVQSGGVYTALQDCILKSDYTYTNIIMAVASWNSSTNIYSFESQYPSTTYDIEAVLPQESATNDQRKALSKADIGGYYSTNIVKAHGTIPEIDIPVTLVIRAK